MILLLLSIGIDYIALIAEITVGVRITMNKGIKGFVKGLKLR
jgi:hypothetical protein